MKYQVIINNIGKASRVIPYQLNKAVFPLSSVLETCLRVIPYQLNKYFKLFYTSLILFKYGTVEELNEIKYLAKFELPILSGSRNK